MKRSLALLLILTAAFFAGPAPAYAQRIDQLPILKQQSQQQQPKRKRGTAPKAAPAPAPAPSIMAAPTPAPMMFDENIVAVVNDNIISSVDLNARMAMAFLASGLPNTPEVRNRLVVQLMHTMVDEKLQIQEAKKLDINIPKEDINRAMDKIATDNRIPGGNMRAFLASRGIPAAALEDQIRAGLSWAKVIQRELRPRVEVGDDEVDAVIERTRANAGKQEYAVSEIFLSVDNPKDEGRVKQFADNLVEQLKQGGNFGGVAHQFSQEASAASGGDIGWIQEGQLAPELNRALTQLQPGAVAGPIRSASGYYIIGLREMRTIAGGESPQEATVELQQAFRPFGPGADKDTLSKEAAQMRASIDGCKDLESKLSSQFPAWHWQNLGAVKLASAPAWLADQARTLPVGKASEPSVAGKGALVLFVCSRSIPEGKIDREAITNQIGNEKLDLQARGLLRDLRRDAFLDIRLGSSPSTTPNG